MVHMPATPSPDVLTRAFEDRVYALESEIETVNEIIGGRLAEVITTNIPLYSVNAKAYAVGDGVTDVDGHVLRIGFAPARNWTLNAQYYANKRFKDRATLVDGAFLSDVDYERLQLDFNVKF